MSVSSYERVRMIGDDTRLSPDFGDDLVWRNFNEEQTRKFKSRESADNIKDTAFRLFCFVVYVWFFIGSPYFAHLTGSILTGLEIGIIPYFIMILCSWYLDKLDEMHWALLPIMLISPIGWVYLFIFYIIMFIFSLRLF